MFEKIATDIGFLCDLEEVLSNYCANISLMKKQMEATNVVYHHHADLLVNLPTGYGKSLIFHLLAKP